MIICLNRQAPVALLLALAMWHAAVAQPEPPLINALALPNGAFIISAPASYAVSASTDEAVAPWSPEALVDGTTRLGWCSAANSPLPIEFVVELSEPYRIEQLRFNTQCQKEYQGISARKVNVEFSQESPASGFSTAGTFILQEQSNATIPLATPATARWVRLTILSNHGNPSFTELMEVEALGRPISTEVPAIDLTGRWQTNWGWVDIQQEGSNITGNYEYRNGVIPQGGMQRRVASFRWVESEANAEGRAVLVVNAEGNRLNGIWCHGDDLSRYGFWVFRRVQQSVGTGGNMTEERAAAQLHQDIDTKGRAIIYGINFATGSADILPESEGTLRTIGRLLTDHPTLQLLIEGHTDNVGDRTDNQRLSQRRAESVRAHLIARHNIAPARLQAEGRGEAEPIGDNNFELGRAANRRVELKELQQ
ncbi:MAG: OmpA family protein [Armatimonadetes bacterium]|nr:OmpA family protein [Armatimonadota bacterium]